MAETDTAEHERLRDLAWKRWGPYMTERAWGTVREDAPDDNQPWEHVPFEHARFRAFRWAEDGLAGFCDSEQRLCMAPAFWNERDAILKERLFGLGNTEGNHGEDIKELYAFVDGLPSHAYMKALYTYPQVAFPYDDLRRTSAERDGTEPEYELTDALRQPLAEQRYFDITIEYAKVGAEDILCRITAINRGPDAAPLHLLPQLWLRNTWAWDDDATPPQLTLHGDRVRIDMDGAARYWWAVRMDGETPRWLFTDNETNTEATDGRPNASRYTKDGIGEAVVRGSMNRVNPEQRGTRCAAHMSLVVEAGATVVVETRLSDTRLDAPFDDAGAIFQARIREADAYYAVTQRDDLSATQRRVQRQAFAGLTWSKGFYHFDVGAWLGDASSEALNREWPHVDAHDILSMPDKWEYPWFAAWDQVFQAVTIALVDAAFARQQIEVLLTHRYQHPDGRIPAFEGDFSMTNPPIHPWGALHVYHIERQTSGKGDVAWLKRVFHKLWLHYGGWFVHPPKPDHNPFPGGFLGMDNISVFDRNEPPPGGGRLLQADSYGWTGLLTLSLLEMAVELAQTDATYEDVALQLVSGLDYVADALLHPQGAAQHLWHEGDGFYYDVLVRPDHEPEPLRIRSYVGLVPLLAISTLPAASIDGLPRLKARLDQFAADYPGQLSRHDAQDGRLSLALLPPERARRLLEYVADPDEFLSDYGVRSLSRFHDDHPFSIELDGETQRIDYEPGYTASDVAGGNSNWRGPVWAPVNHLLIEALRKYHLHCGDALVVRDPTNGHGTVMLDAFADVLCARLVNLFLPDANGRRPIFGDRTFFQDGPAWRELVLFYEHFHGDDGHGLGASHQNGWTALIAKLLQDRAAV